MIEIKGTFVLKGSFSVLLDKTEEELNQMSDRSIDELLDSTIDWQEEIRNAQADSFDIDDIIKI